MRPAVVPRRALVFLLVVASLAGGVVLAPAGAQTGDEGDQPPSITIVLDAAPDAAVDFGFTSCRGTDCTDFALDDDADPTLARSVTMDALEPGEYTVTQAATPDWKLIDILCDHGASVRLGQRRVTFDLGAADAVTCTFTNRTQSITVVQDAVPDGPQDFVFTRCDGSTCVPFTLDDDADGTLAATQTASELPAGVYTISQTAPPGWPLVSLVCSSGEVVDLATGTVAITLSPAEHATCTFTNGNQSITVVQDTQPDDPHDFTFTTCGPDVDAPCDEFALDDDADPTLSDTHTLAGLRPGTYELNQHYDPAFERRIGCTVPVAYERGRVFLTLEPGTHPTCTFRNLPLPPPLVGAGPVSTGSGHTCVRFGRQARCWGDNGTGELGDGTTTERSRPVVVLDDPGDVPLTGVAAIVAGYSTTCARLTDGQARCWGANTHGVVGDGTTTDRSFPAVVSNPDGTGPLTGVAQIVVGGNHACALLRNGRARCWGSNRYLQLGDGSQVEQRRRPRVVLDRAGTGPLGGIVQLVAGSGHTCALLDDGQARCWGDDQYGQLGHGGRSPAGSSARLVRNGSGRGPLAGIVQLTAGNRHTCALLENGQARCWGSNRNGQLGAGVGEPQRSLPVPVSNPSGRRPLSGIVQLDAGGTHTCARLGNGQLRCWGNNFYGGLGDGTLVRRDRPVPVLDPSATAALADAVQVSAGWYHTCARLTDGGTWCWGRNSQSQLGVGSTGGYRSLPAPVAAP